MKTRGKRIALIIIAIFLLIFDGMWLLACLFAVGQLYNTYDLKMYLSEAPVAVVILIGLFVAAVVCVVMAITLKDKSDKGKIENSDQGDKDQSGDNNKKRGTRTRASRITAIRIRAIRTRAATTGATKDEDKDEVQEGQIRE